MNADEAQELFSEAYEGELSEERQREFQAALAADAELAAEYASFESALVAAGAPCRTPPDGCC